MIETPSTKKKLSKNKSINEEDITIHLTNSENIFCRDEEKNIIKNFF